MNTVKNIAKDVWRTLGSGFSESVYHRAMEIGLRDLKIPYHSEVIIPVNYKNKNCGNVRADILLDDIVIELKATSKIMQKDVNQLECYMKLLSKSSGLVINFTDTKVEIKESVCIPSATLHRSSSI